VTQGNVTVTTAEVRRSADQMDVVAEEAASSRAAVADSVSTQGAGWKEKGTPGFGKFVGVLEDQAERLRTDLTDLGDKLRAAADVYDKQDVEAGGAFDSSMR
jgi:uncharacterized protein YukE